MNDFIIVGIHPEFGVRVILRHIEFKEFFFGMFSFKQKIAEKGNRESFIFITTLEKARIAIEHINAKYPEYHSEILSFSKTFPSLFQKHRNMQIRHNDTNANYDGLQNGE